MTEVKKIVITEEEQLSVFRGVRPPDMRQDVFKKVRKDLKKALKLYLGGKYKHLSINLTNIPGLPEGQGTYIRKEPKGWELRKLGKKSA